MPEPRILQVLNDFTTEIHNRDADSLAYMTRRWLDVERNLDTQIQALAQDIDALRRAGKEISRGKLMRMERYKALLRQTIDEVDKYQSFADNHIRGEQRDAYLLGGDAAQAALRSARVGVNFNHLPADAANNMIGFCQDGSPLFDVLKKRALSPDAVDGLTTQLINAVALGYSPRKTADMIKAGLEEGLSKALTIARTEQMRAYREATFQSYNVNDEYLDGWIWLSACQTRTCAACWAMHGTKHPVTERLNDHVNGRCTMAPIVRLSDTETLSVPMGEERFAKLSPDKQNYILGDVRYQMYKDGKLDFSSLAKFTDDPTWGKSVQITPMKELNQ